MRGLLFVCDVAAAYTRLLRNETLVSTKGVCLKQCQTNYLELVEYTVEVYGYYVSSGLFLVGQLHGIPNNVGTHFATCPLRIFRVFGFEPAWRPHGARLACNKWDINHAWCYLGYEVGLHGENCPCWLRFSVTSQDDNTRLLS